MTEAHQPPSTHISRAVPLLLSFIAGYVDACTFLGLFGVFVAQVTGSFVLAGTQLVRQEPGALAKLLAIPFFFLAGFAAAIVAHGVGQRTRAAFAWSLIIECGLLIGFLVTGVAGAPMQDADAPAALVALAFGMAAMGVQSAMVRLVMRGVPSTNVMTTNTTQLAVDVAEWLIGRIELRSGRGARDCNARYERARNGIMALVPNALGFFVGTAAGALAYAAVGLSCVLLVITLLAGLALWAARTDRSGVAV